jgi:hypothetical protein
MPGDFCYTLHMRNHISFYSAAILGILVMVLGSIVLTQQNAVHENRFVFPETLSTKYVSTVEWPPLVQVKKGTFVCEESGSDVVGVGRVEKRLVNGREYCVTTLREGAAGSTYSKYTYVFARGAEVVTMQFTLRAVTCENYDEPAQSECKVERAAFSVDAMIDQIVRK